MRRNKVDYLLHRKALEKAKKSEANKRNMKKMLNPDGFTRAEATHLIANAVDVREIERFTKHQNKQVQRYARRKMYVLREAEIKAA